MQTTHATLNEVGSLKCFLQLNSETRHMEDCSGSSTTSCWPQQWPSLLRKRQEQQNSTQYIHKATIVGSTLPPSCPELFLCKICYTHTQEIVLQIESNQLHPKPQSIKSRPHISAHPRPCTQGLKHMDYPLRDHISASPRSSLWSTIYFGLTYGSWHW